MSSNQNQIDTAPTEGATEGGRSFLKSVNRSSRSRRSNLEKRSSTNPDQLDVIESQQTETMAEEGTPTDGLDKPTVESTLQMPEEEKKVEETDEELIDTVERLCVNFQFPCCGGAANGAVPVQEDPAMLEAQSGGDVDAHKRSNASLADIVARMDALDVETADGEETEGGSSRDGGDAQNLKKGVFISKVAPWVKEPLYASLIAACIVFIVAIIVMSILLATSK